MNSPLHWVKQQFYAILRIVIPGFSLHDATKLCQRLELTEIITSSSIRTGSISNGKPIFLPAYQPAYSTIMADPNQIFFGK